MSNYYYKARDVYGWALQASPGAHLEEKSLSKLMEALSSLPKSDVDPEKGLAILVSFMEGDEWRTEIYSASAIPKELETVMEILGERFEAKTEPSHAPERRWPEFSGDVF